MIGIRAISSWIPEDRIDNVKRASLFGRAVSFVDERLGFEKLSRIESHQTTAEMAANAFFNLPLSLIDELTSVSSGIVVLVTQTPDDEGLPHTSPSVCSRIGTNESVGSFDIGLGCSGYPYAVDVVQSLVRERQLDFGLVLTADPYSKSLDEADHTTSLIFGDASTATVIGSDPHYMQVDSLYFTDGGRGEFIRREDGSIKMNGREVLRFAKNVVPRQIMDLLDRHSLTPNDIDVFVLHQASRVVVQTIAESFPGQRDRFIWVARETGNTVSSSIPLALETVLRNPGTLPDRIVCAGFGVGLSAATSLLERSR